MDGGNTLGIKTFLFYIFQKTIFGFLLLFLAINLPAIAQFVTSIGNLSLDQSSYDMINRVGNMAMAFLFIFSIIIIFIGVILSWIKHISNTYTLEEYAIKLRRGFIAKTEVSIPYKAIEDVNVRQSIFFRLLGLSSLIVTSGGNEDKKAGASADEVFSIIDSELAENLRKTLLEKSNVQETKEVR